MNTNNIPAELVYNFVRPKGFSSEYQEWTVNPMGGQNTIQPSEILRYQLNLSDGFFDPYRSYFEIEVSTDIPTGLLQVDGSAFGFISQSLLVNNSAEIERISEYDQVASILTQLGYPEVFATGRDYEGLGRSYFQNQSKVSNVVTSSQSIGVQNIYNNQSTQLTAVADISGQQFNPLFLNANQSTIGGGLINSWGKGWTNPLTGGENQNGEIQKKSKWNKVTEEFKNLSHKMDLEAEALIVNGLTFLPPNTLGMSPSLVSQMNLVALTGAWWAKCEINSNGCTLPRSEYSMATSSLRYLDTKNSILRNTMRGKTLINSFDPVNPGVKYDVDFASNINCHYVTSASLDGEGNEIGSPTLISQSNTCDINGFQQPYSVELSIGADEPFISPTVPQCAMQNGIILPKPLPVKTKRFIVPFLSAVMGIQIPREAYALLPLKAFQNTIIELTLNKYAMFSSGYNDRNIYDANGMLYPILRNFYFTKFNYVLQMYNFNDPDIRQYMETSLLRGIVFTTEITNLTSTYMVSNQLSLRGTWTVNTTAGSITHVFVRFLDNRYLQYPFLRKQYALSCNVTSFQLKFDTKYYPPQPIIGNAGNPEYLDSTGNVQPYLNMLYSASDWLFNQKPLPIINPLNFAINSRVFDPDNTKTYLPNNNSWTPYTQLPQNWVNCDTAMGFPYFHENRCIGRALYVYNFEPQGHSAGMMNGLNAGRSRPFEIIMNTSVKDPNPNEIGMYVFIKSHQIVSISSGGVRTQDLGTE